MSHTTKIDSVALTDVGAIQAAVAELKANGVNCSLRTNEKPRAYYSSQEGMTEPADFLIYMEDGPYDLALYKNEKGEYEPRYDNWNSGMSKYLGVQAESSKLEDKNTAEIGKFLQLYAVCATEIQAAQQGYSVQRNTMEDGTIQLVLDS